MVSPSPGRVSELAPISTLSGSTGAALRSAQWPAVSTMVGATSVPVHSGVSPSIGNITAATSGHLPGGASVPPVTGALVLDTGLDTELDPRLDPGSVASHPAAASEHARTAGTARMTPECRTPAAVR